MMTHGIICNSTSLASFSAPDQPPYCAHKGVNGGGGLGEELGEVHGVELRELEDGDLDAGRGGWVGVVRLFVRRTRFVSGWMNDRKSWRTDAHRTGARAGPTRATSRRAHSGSRRTRRGCPRARGVSPGRSGRRTARPAPPASAPPPLGSVPHLAKRAGGRGRGTQSGGKRRGKGR